ncbi:MULTISPECIES: DUF4260 domain-containing protein [unclassified Spirosoma]|uniref:DUF4260 domain-containing protein n=1 Tax=unclassified Spirosoma TaxID=2621999 RepID=UPI0009629EF3|nr:MULTISPECIES: DUF4260 domain-containing protein [unclassified Spirosoma]MBN8823628.1 DUF4260 domain-containing protein [Spirosoma sp.]OJW76814.1 MAG: hypothetical protein BGO59_21530 [Spirosoma sp. 48-14]
MKTLLKSEELIQFLAAIYLFSRLNFAWWWFPALILVPDISMIGYLVNPAIGAVLYNIVHHKGLGIAIGLVGLMLGNQQLMLAGVILFAHSSMDRTMGYGLKYFDSFKHTSLGDL